MPKSCPECGSSEIIPELPVFADAALAGREPPYVKLVEPAPANRPFVWTPKTAATGFFATICGSCGYTRFYAKSPAQLLEAYKQGFTSQ